MVGIRGLQSFMRKFVPNGYFSVDLEKAIAAERQRTKRNPLLVIDVNALAGSLATNNTDMIYGGRGAVIIKQINSFLTKLKSFDVDLVFFAWGVSFDTSSDTSATVSNLENKLIDYLKIEKIIDQICNDVQFTELTNSNYQNKDNKFLYTNTSKYAFKSICSKYGEMKFIWDKEKAMVDHAVKHNALAIIGNSTNFLIYSGNWRFWCSNDLHINSMKIMEFNRYGLRQKISLQYYQLPLFATCCGNYYINYDDIQEFHNGFGKNKFPNIAKYVKQYKHPDDLSVGALKQLTIDLYGEYTEQNMILIRKSIDFYNDECYKHNEGDYIVRNKYKERWLYDVAISYIAYDGKIKIRNMHLNNGLAENISYIDIVLPILKRQMGVMLKHKNNPELKRILHIKPITYEYSDEFVAVTPTYPEIENMSNDELYRLTYEAHSDMDDSRWKILCWMISDLLYEHLQKLKTLPKHYLCSCLTLYYLVQSKIITIWEADIILLTIDEHYKNGIPDEIEYPKMLEKRAFLLSCLFAKLYESILRCINIAGLRDYMELQIFDGVYYHNLMRELCETSEELQMAAIKDIKNYRIYCI